jgi:cytochrome c553
MRRPRSLHIVSLLAACAFAGVASQGAGSAEIAAADKLQFNRDIRPILSENCFYCHGRDPNKRKAGLRLDVRDGATKPVESGGVAIVPGGVGKSEMVARIFSVDPDEQMPPAKSNRVLTAQQKETLKRWIAEGAKYEPHWAYIAPIRAELPQVKNPEWVRNPIDRFVLAKLQQNGLKPSPEGVRATLIRRLSLDLIGLPPTPAEVDAFEADAAPDAYEKLVDRLMSSEHYGERMALPWLDAARYADSNGFQQDGDTYQWVWRDWVVRAMNADMPFDRFSIEQLAGDLLPNPTSDQLVATAFNRNHLLNGEGGAIAEEQRFNILFDRIDTTATTWLGLTMACAECHDHKFDPVTQRDYYSLLAAFNQVSESGLAGGGSGAKRVASPFIEIRTDEDKAHLAELETQLAKNDAEGQVKQKFELAFAAWMSAATPDTRRAAKNLPLPGNLSAILRIKPDKRAASQQQQLEKGMRVIFHDEVWPVVAAQDPAAKRSVEIESEIARSKKEEMPRVMVMRDDRPRDTFMLDRGDYLKPKENVTFATPEFLPPLPKDAPRNRLGFARWLFLPAHPLTARVQINRMWQHLFGIGLVKTAEDLGVQSELPPHQQLLDWLAVEFRESGWSMKHMNRLIVTSATYRQSSRVTRDLLERDPDNRLLSRGARFRLPAMVLRDVALSASGLLDAQVGGKPVYPYQPEGIWESLAITHERDFTYPTSTGKDLYRRSLYTFWRRTLGPANMFDASTRQTCRVRTATTDTPLHALTTLNDPTWTEAARVLAAHSLEASSAVNERLIFAFRRVLGRRPGAGELAMLHQTFDRQYALYKSDLKSAAEVVSIGAAPKNSNLNVSEHAAMTAVCLAILNLDEALTRE